MQKLMAEYPRDYGERIERLSEYMASTGKRYDSHLATIRSWARREKEADFAKPVTYSAANAIKRYSHDKYNCEVWDSL